MEKTILLADDSQDDSCAVRLALSQAGVNCQVNEIRDGEETIAYLSGVGVFNDRLRYPFPDILLLDLFMPRITGFQVLEWIKNHPKLPRFLVVVLSGYKGLREINRAYALGAHSFLFKPCQPAELINLVEAFPEFWLPHSETNTFKQPVWF